jgi:predicted DCC family thiol-disulfide oxidoreductase YuxK
MCATVIYDGDCGLCSAIRSGVEALDWLGTMRWVPLQSPEAAKFGIAREELERSIYVVSRGGEKWQGWRAVKRIVFRIPLTYVVIAALARRNPWAAAGIATLLSPIANPAGEAVYELVARNRHRFPASTCASPVWDNQGNE